MTEQYKIGSSVGNYLKKLGVHPINMAEAVSDNKWDMPSAGHFGAGETCLSG